MHSAHDLVTRWPSLDVAATRARLRESFQLSPGSLAQSIVDLDADAERAAAGLWRSDASIWSDDPTVQQKIANRLGWMKSPALMAEALPRLFAFAETIKSASFTDIVLLGMGGSSLAPEVLRAVIGVAPGWPRFQMLDSTDPAAVRAAATPPHQTLYLLASKSGSTIEPNVLAAHFQSELRYVPRWADHFVAITDEGTPLAERARTEGFRDLFINPADIGGRFSALSYFGLVPAALMGQNVAALIGWGSAMLTAAEPGVGAASANPAVALGLTMAAGARVRRDKLTLLVPPALEPFGLWVEQLVAESTGKQGVGVVPIAGEPLAEPSAYGDDRIFIRLRLDGLHEEEKRDPQLRGLRDTGAPVASIDLSEPLALGAEFMRWEIATAVAGALLGINPFDEPNVQQAKDATRVLLDRYKADGSLPSAPPSLVTADGVAFTLSSAARDTLAGAPQALLTLAEKHDYVALLAYLGPDAEIADALRRFRLAVRDRTRLATMFAYGPRYLHSTGQLHKGGANSGVFVMVTATPRVDLAIPGEAFSFGTLELAQALGDFHALDAAGRRALHVHLPAPEHRLIESVAESLLEQLSRHGSA
jgi:glucose-6-phosphate isomerase